MTDNTVNSLVQQLKDSALITNSVYCSGSINELKEENLEQYILNNTSELINQSMDMIRSIKDYAIASNDPEQISALADLVNASTGSIESLNKIALQNKKIKASIKLKEMDIEIKKEISNNATQSHSLGLVGLVGTREEIFKKILSEAKVIDATVINISSSPDVDIK